MTRASAVKARTQAFNTLWGVTIGAPSPLRDELVVLTKRTLVSRPRGCARKPATCSRSVVNRIGSCWRSNTLSGIHTPTLADATADPSYEYIRSWLGDLPGPVSVAHEAGPTGFGWSRSLIAAGIRCQVVAPSKLQRPLGDHRIKTHARDVLHLVRLPQMEEFTPVSIPTIDHEDAWDLTRGREDCRGDLPSARHHLSKLLLRQGIVSPAVRPGLVPTKGGFGGNGSMDQRCR